MLPHTTHVKCLGFLTSCMAALVHQHVGQFHVRYCGAISLAMSRQSCMASNTFIFVDGTQTLAALARGFKPV